MASDEAGVQHHLSTLQLLTLRHAAQGLSTTEIAAALGLEPDQVRHALLAAPRQLDARTKLEAILHAARSGQLNLEC